MTYDEFRCVGDGMVVQPETIPTCCPVPYCCTGPTGPTGATGPQGEPGAAPEARYFHAATVTGGQTIPPGGDVAFDLIGQQSDGFSFSSGRTEIVVREAGVYRVSYGVALSPPVTGTYAITVNGMEYSLARFGVALATGNAGDRVPVSGESLIPLESGSVITLRNVGADENALPEPEEGGVTATLASLTMIRIS